MFTLTSKETGAGERTLIECDKTRSGRKKYQHCDVLLTRLSTTHSDEPEFGHSIRRSAAGEEGEDANGIVGEKDEICHCGRQRSIPARGSSLRMYV